MGSGERSGSLSWLALAILALGLSALGCGGSGAQAEHASTSDKAGRSPASATATVGSGGLTVTLMATPKRSKVGSSVEFNATAYERHARGAIGYQLLYGDGATTPPSVLPQFCLVKPRPAHKTWRLSHRYTSPGKYTVSLSVDVNCTRDHATASVTVIVV